jgi:hypothetical protein
MNLKYSAIILSQIILSNTVYAISASILDHKNPGCPTNSLCHREFGIKRMAWKNVLKSPNKSLDQFKSKNGLPITFWSQAEKEENKSTSYWHSHCFNHQSKNVSLMLAQRFAKSYSLLKLKDTEYVPKVLVQDGKKTQVYTSIPFDSPVAIKNNSLIYNREDDGTYYSISIYKDGRMDASHKIVKPKNLPQSIDCSKELQESFSKLKFPKGLYQASFCKAVWNIDKKRFQTMILGWSCN